MFLKQIDPILKILKNHKTDFKDLSTSVVSTTFVFLYEEISKQTQFGSVLGFVLVIVEEILQGQSKKKDS